MKYFYLTLIMVTVFIACSDDNTNIINNKPVCLLESLNQVIDGDPYVFSFFYNEHDLIDSVVEAYSGDYRYWIITYADEEVSTVKQYDHFDPILRLRFTADFTYQNGNVAMIDYHGFDVENFEPYSQTFSYTYDSNYIILNIFHII